MFFAKLSVIAKFLEKDIDKFKEISDKQKNKKDLFTGETRRVWNRGKRTQMPFTSTEDIAATDKG